MNTDAWVSFKEILLSKNTWYKGSLMPINYCIWLDDQFLVISLVAPHGSGHWCHYTGFQSICILYISLLHEFSVKSPWDSRSLEIDSLGNFHDVIVGEWTAGVEVVAALATPDKMAAVKELYFLDDKPKKMYPNRRESTPSPSEIEKTFSTQELLTAVLGTMYSPVWLITHSTVVPNTADRSSGVQKVFSITDGGGGAFASINVYNLCV